MNRARNHILAYAAFARQQHRRARRRHSFHRLKDLAHRRATPDDVVELIAPVQFVAHPPVLIAQRLHRHHFFHYGAQMFQRKRLLQKIGRPQLHRFHRVFH